MPTVSTRTGQVEMARATPDADPAVGRAAARRPARALSRQPAGRRASAASGRAGEGQPLPAWPAPNAKALLLDLYGGFARRLDNWMPIAGLVRLLADLGVDEPATRAAASRMTRAGLLARARGRAGGVGYLLTSRALAILAEGDRRIFQRQQPASVDDGWALVVFSVPEAQRHLRHALRSRLTHLGCGNAAPGVWLAPCRLLGELQAAVEPLGLTRYVDVYEARYRGYADVAQLVRRCWDLDALRAHYLAFVAAQAPVLARWEAARDPVEPRAAFVDYVFAQSAWRHLAYRDPGLPGAYLPEPWAGDRAAELFFRLKERLAGPAFEHVRASVGY